MIRSLGDADPFFGERFGVAVEAIRVPKDLRVSARRSSAHGCLLAVLYSWLGSLVGIAVVLAT